MQQLTLANHLLSGQRLDSGCHPSQEPERRLWLVGGFPLNDALRYSGAVAIISPSIAEDN